MVVGYHAAQVCAAVAQVPNMQVRCVHNADYERSGTAYSTGLGLSAIGNRDVVVIEGDVLFSPELLIALLSHSAENVALIDDFVGHTGSLVTLDGDRVTAWLHEHARAPDFDVFGTWKTVNLTRLAARSVRPGLHTAISAAMSTHGPTAPLEYALQFWIEHGAYIAGMSTAGLRWFEVDTIADLSTAVALFGEC